MSSSAHWTYKTLCQNPKCGHDKDTHHEEKHNCLASFCDCRGYDDGKRPSTIPPPPATPKTFSETKPHASIYCICYACKEWERQKIDALNP